MIDDIIFLAIGGFLIGSLLYTGWYTTRYEPETKTGYAVVGVGAVIAVTANTWLEFQANSSHWFLGVTLVGYALVAIGLIFISRERYKRAKRERSKRKYPDRRA